MLSAKKRIVKRLITIILPFNTLLVEETNINTQFFCRNCTVKSKQDVTNLPERILKVINLKYNKKKNNAHENNIYTINSRINEDAVKEREKEKEKNIYKTNNNCYNFSKKRFCKYYLIFQKGQFKQLIKKLGIMKNNKIHRSNKEKQKDMFYDNFANSSEMDEKGENKKKDEINNNNNNNNNIIENKKKGEMTNGWEGSVETKKRNVDNEKTRNHHSYSSYNNSSLHNSVKKRRESNGKEGTSIRYEEKYEFEKFSIFSFNILANSLVDEKYDKNNSDVMKWINRKKSIFLDVLKKKADIICLQEVEEEYFNELKVELEKRNYKGMYFKKKKEFCKDGLCIFYNCKVFELLFFDEIVFDKSDILKKWQVGLIVALKNLKTKKFQKERTKGNDCTKENLFTKDSSTISSNDTIDNDVIDDILIVGNTHLAFDYFKGDVKLYQLCYLTYRIIIMLNRCINYLKRKNGKTNILFEQDIIKPGIVLCGDFNLTPNSLLYYYIINRFINLKNINLELLSGQYLMFQKELYFNYCVQKKQMKNLFDENIIADLQKKQNKKCTENVQKEALFHFFRNKNILKEEYITNMFQTKKNGLIDYDTFENIFANKNYANDAVKAFFQSICGIRTDEREKKSDHNYCTVYIDEEKDKKGKDINHKTTETNIIKEESKPQEHEDLILYYPLYFKSVYNSMCKESSKEEACYKYDTMDHLLNNKNNEIKDKLPFTVFHGKQKGCVDYIFYSYKHLDMVTYSKLPPFETLSKWGCLPNEKYSSSDHLYLHATLIRKK